MGFLFLICAALLLSLGLMPTGHLPGSEIHLAGLRPTTGGGSHRRHSRSPAMTASVASSQYEILLSEAAHAHYGVDHLLTPGGIDSPMKLTALVSCYNESAFIEQTLEDICLALRQAVRSFEILVIDDASVDDSQACVARFIDRHLDEFVILRRNLTNQRLSKASAGL